MSKRALFSKAVYLAPLGFAGGFALKEYNESQQRIDQIVEKRVRQRLGEWTPPNLSPSNREELLRERQTVLDDLSKTAKHSLAR